MTDTYSVNAPKQELYNCHRLLIAEYLSARCPQQIEIIHLGLAYDRYGNEKGAVPPSIMNDTRVYIKSLVENRGFKPYIKESSAVFRRPHLSFHERREDEQ